MGQRTNRFALFGAGLLLVASPPGCASMHMAPSSHPQAIHATPDRATVVFIRSRDAVLPHSQVVTFVDGDGRFMGQLDHGDHFAITMPPGPRRFIGFFREHADTIRADLAAGSIYYVLVKTVPSGTYAQVVLRALDQRQPEWAERSALLDDTRQLMALVDEGQAALDPGEAQRKIADADRRWVLLSERERRARQLDPSDGERDPTLPSELATLDAAGSPSRALGRP